MPFRWFDWRSSWNWHSLNGWSRKSTCRLPVWGRCTDLELLCSVAVLYLSVLSFHNKWRVSSLWLFCASRNASLLLSWGETVVWFQWCEFHINSLSAYYWIEMRDNLCERRAHVWGFWPALEHQSIPVTGYHKMQHNQQEHCYVNNISFLLALGDH